MSLDKKISLVIPVYNEESNLSTLIDNLGVVLSNVDYDYELIFVNDGSVDRSAEIISGIIKINPKIKALEFSRNFGKEVAITAGINSCGGECCIIMDADLQHPVELIPDFIKKWEDGAEVVVGVREKNQHEGLVKKIGSWFFHKINNLISETEMAPRATDYRLIDKKVILEFNRFTEKNRIARGLIAWLGFKREYIYFIANPRYAGKPGYGFLKLAKLALSTFVSHSLFPLKLAGYMGVLITILSGLLAVFMLADKYFLKDYWRLNFSGPALLAVLLLFLVGIILCCLGLIALYIANIYGEVNNRPLYIIRQKENFD